MEGSNESLYAKIFYVIGIIAFLMFILWLGYKFYPVVKRNLFGTRNRPIGTCEVEDCLRDSSRDETSVEEWNETRVIYRKNHSVHRSSETGFWDSKCARNQTHNM